MYANLPEYPWDDPQHFNFENWAQWWPSGCLSLPVSEVIRLQPSQHPLPWLHHCMGAVLGAEGKFSLRQDEFETIDDNHPLTPSGPGNDSTDVRALNTRDPEFRFVIRNQDAITLALSSCQAAHLVPHSEGDNYIHTLTTRRSRGITADVVSAVDDARNRLFLDPSVHKGFGTDFAFLRAPDVVPVGNASMALTPHYFSNGPGRLLADTIDVSGPHLPSRILLDAIYGSLVMRHYGVRDTFAHFTRIRGAASITPKGQ
ncbi:hypothetical protein LXA43DRAFT_1058607 [Ganoderma leucocontextum]|nr:hypothetical protein LXA43DRAFT_1058607 [Ganoderma leucocontextum]